MTCAFVAEEEDERSAMFAFINFKRFGFFFNSLTQIFQKSNRNTSNVINGKSSMEVKVKMLLKRYEDIFGITKLTEVHDRVLQVQAKLHDVQQKRRKVQENVLIIQENLQEIQAKLEKISRGDDMFLSVVTQEHECIKEQRRLHNLLEIFDQTEREEQTALALAISISQDHERTYRERTKYLSVITGIIGALIGVIGSSVNNWRHRKDIKLFASDISDLIKANNLKYQDYGTDNANTINEANKLMNMLNEQSCIINDTSSISKQLQIQTDNLLKLVKTQEDVLLNVVNNVNSFINNDYCNDGFFTNLYEKKILSEVDKKIDKKIFPHIYVTTIFMSLTLVLTVVIINIMNN